jgi:hypothetical protein
MLAHSPRAFPLGADPPVGASQGKRKRRPKARARRPRPRSCLRKECGRKYLPRRWNQRYCHEPECQRRVHRWQAARRQAKHRQNDFAKARHAEAEKLHRQQAKLTSQVDQKPDVMPARGHADGSTENIFSAPLCDRPGCYETPVTSIRNPARYCCPACRQAVGNVHDRERKWRFRFTDDGRTKRAHEYRAARKRRLLRRNTSVSVPLRAPPE